MRYLFFDIECANCFQGKGKICSFGYVITDTSFTVLEKEDILINPKSKFHLRGATEGIDLAYPESEFLKQPDFAHFYPKIKELLTEKDQMIFGHSIINDVGFIRSECIRYKLPQIDYEFYDSQTIFSQMTNRKRNISLESIANYFKFDALNSILHKSDDDAYVTMLETKAMAELLEISIEELVNICPPCCGKIINGEIKHKVMSKKEIKNLVNLEMEKIVEKSIPNNKGEFRGKKFSFALEFESCLEVFKLYINALYKHGGVYTFKITNCNAFLLGEKECYRTKQLKERKKNSRIIWLNQEEFRTILGIRKEDYEDAVKKENEFRHAATHNQSQQLIRRAKEKGIYEEGTDENVKGSSFSEVVPVYQDKNPNFVKVLQELLDSGYVHEPPKRIKKTSRNVNSFSENGKKKSTKLRKDN